MNKKIITIEDLRMISNINYVSPNAEILEGYYQDIFNENIYKKMIQSAENGKSGLSFSNDNFNAIKSFEILKPLLEKEGYSVVQKNNQVIILW